MRLEAMKRQGMRSDLTSVPVAQKSKTSREMLGEAVGESQDNVRRYIRLTELIPDLLDLVDEGKIALRPAVELSYLTQDEQKLVYEQILDCDCTPSHAQTIRMRKFSEEGRLNDAVIETIMQEEKPNQKEKIHIPYGQLRKFIPENVSYDDTRNYILEALEFYQKYHAKQHTQNKNNPGKVR
jgi:ParB family chromosome partitioning protein